MMKNKIPSRWMSFIFILLETMSESFGETRIVCYYESWSFYRQGSAKFTPNDIDPHLCTHVVYAYARLSNESKLVPFDNYVDITQNAFRDFTSLKGANPSLKTMISIGGSSEESKHFSSMTESSNSRMDFVKESIRFLREYNFDGMDLDWRYPSDNDKPRDKANFANLVKRIREGFEREAKDTSRTRLLISITGPSEFALLTQGYNLPTLNRYVDWMNILTYDYLSALESFAKHHAPLYSVITNNDDSEINLNVNYTISHYITEGVNSEKIVMAIPTYGRSYTLTDPEYTLFGSSVEGPGLAGSGTNDPGYLAYYEICESLSKSMNNTNDGTKWTVVNENISLVGPYAFNDRQWVSFDDQNTIRLKTLYAAANGLGGVMFWSINNDDFHGICHEKPFPLIQSAKSTYIGLGAFNDSKEMKNGSQEISSFRSSKQNFENNVTDSEKKDQEKRVVCRYDNWSIHRIGSAMFTAKDIDPFLCTHIFYEFRNDRMRTSDNSNKSHSNPNHYFYTDLKLKNPKLKTILSFTSENIPLYNMSRNAEQTIAEFSKNIAPDLRSLAFDGFNFDWRFPGSRNSSEDKMVFVLLEKSLREAFDKEAMATGNSRLLLTINVPPQIERIERGYDIPQLNRYVDWMNILNDYAIDESNSTYHFAPLYHVDNTSDPSAMDRNIDYTVNYLLKKGADPNKIVISVPAYGRLYNLVNRKKNSFESPIFKHIRIGEPSDIAKKNGYLPFFEVCERILSTDNGDNKMERWTIVKNFPNTVGPYAFKDFQWIAFDDPDIAEKKAEYAINKNLGGVLIWSIEDDDFRGQCYGIRYPITKAVRNGLNLSMKSPTPAVLSTDVTSQNFVTITAKQSSVETPTTKSSIKEMPTSKNTQKIQNKITTKPISTTVNPIGMRKKPNVQNIPTTTPNTPILIPEIGKIKTVIPIIVPDTKRKFEPSVQKVKPVYKVPVTTSTPKDVTTSGMFKELQEKNNPNLIMELLTLLNKFGGIKEIEKLLKTENNMFSPSPSVLPTTIHYIQNTNKAIENEDINSATVPFYERFLKKITEEQKYTKITATENSKEDEQIVYSNKTIDEHREEKISYSPKHLFKSKPRTNTEESEERRDRIVEKTIEEYSSDDEDSEDSESDDTIPRRFHSNGYYFYL